MERKLPIYRALIPDETCGMYRVSLVDDPAVDSLFVAFNNQTREAQVFSVANEEKRLVRGVIMRANYPIYRVSPMIGEYYVVFEADIIRKMAEKYLAEGRQNKVNLMHEDGTEVQGVELVQIFIKDTSAGIAPAGFDNIEDGSLFGEYHVLNDEVWAQIKAGTYKGFSLEGFFDHELKPDTQLSKQHTKMTKKDKLKAFLLELAQMVEKFGQVTTDKGVLRWEGEDDLKVGDAVSIVAEDDTEQTPADGDYTIEDGKIVKVVDGKVAEIIDPEAEIEAAEENPEEVDPAPEGEDNPDEVDALLKEIADKIDKINERIDTLEKKVEEANTKMSKTNEEIEALKKAPVEQSVKAKKVENEGRGIDKLARNLKF